MEDWRRCPGTPFYRNLDDGPTEFHMTFLDPVDLVLVRTVPRKDGAVTIYRRRVMHVEIEPIRDNFVQESAERIEAWVRRVSESSRLEIPGWRQEILDDLDVDTAERDGLLQSLEILVDLNFLPVHLHAMQAPRIRADVAAALWNMGIGAC